MRTVRRCRSPKIRDAVGEFGSDGQHESFGDAVRPRTSRRDLDGVGPGAGQDRVEGGGELPGAVADEEPEGGGALLEVHQRVAGLLGCPAPVGWQVVPRMCT
jgi:hypothetical protein